MYHLFENPIRRDKMLPGRAFFVAVAIGTAPVIGLALNLPDDDPNVLDLSTASPGERPAHGPEGHAEVAGDQRVMVVGDSMSWSVWVGLDDWGKTHHVQFGRTRRSAAASAVPARSTTSDSSASRSPTAASGTTTSARRCSRSSRTRSSW